MDIRRIGNWLLRHGYWLMGIGMTLLIVAVVMAMQRLGPGKLVVYSIGIAGLAVYACGRVCVSMERQAAARRRAREETL
jgi:hypothetical protein